MRSMLNKNLIAEPTTQRLPTGIQHSKMGKLALVALAAILLISLISTGAQAKKNKYVYTCITTTTMYVCVKRDSLKRCTKIKKKKKCTGWLRTRISSRIVSPEIDKVKRPAPSTRKRRWRRGKIQTPKPGTVQ